MANYLEVSKKIKPKRGKKMELVITAPKNEKFANAITFNFEELKAELRQRLVKYDGLVVTVDAIKDAKADRATLNKLKSALNERRKEIKKQYLEPYMDFENKINELIKLIDEPCLLIDEQIKVFESSQKNEKMNKLRDYWQANAGELTQFVNFEKQIFDERWGNAGSRLVTTVKIIQEKIDNINKDFAAVQSLCKNYPKYETVLKNVYFQTLDLGKCLYHAEELREQEIRLAEMEAREIARAEELRAQHLAQQTQGQVQEAPEPEPVHVNPGIEALPNPAQPAMKQKDIRVWCTQEQWKLLVGFCKESGIKISNIIN